MQDVDKGEVPVQLAPLKDGPLVALAFKLEEGRFGQLTYMRIYSGTLRKGDFVTNTTTGKRIKVRDCSRLRPASHRRRGNTRKILSLPIKI